MYYIEFRNNLTNNYFQSTCRVANEPLQHLENIILQLKPKILSFRTKIGEIRNVVHIHICNLYTHTHTHTHTHKIYMSCMMHAHTSVRVYMQHAGILIQVAN